jgi:hypothetical protein
MSNNKLNPSEMGLVLSVKECIRIASDIVEEQKDAAKRARSMKSKKMAKRSVEFWSAIVYHLERLKEEQA